MNLVKESISFQRGVDPKTQLGIGIYYPKKFNTIEEAANYLISALPEILGTEKIPKDIVRSDIDKRGYRSIFLSWKYYITIANYVDEYLDISNREIFYKLLHSELVKKGYKTI